MAKKNAWHLDPAEVGWATDGSTSTRRRKRRLSRKLDNRSLRLRLTHIPTGISVSGEIPTGNYSKNEMKAAEEELSANLFNQLESKVARHLRIPGR